MKFPVFFYQTPMKMKYFLPKGGSLIIELNMCKLKQKEVLFVKFTYSHSRCLPCPVFQTRWASI